MSDNNRNLYYLDELSDYKVASDDCDVRGWKVKDADNRTIGKVDDLLVNKIAERVVYLDVEVDKSLLEDDRDDTNQIPVADGAYGFMNKDGDNHLIIPIGMVRLDEENENVVASGIDYKTFGKIKRFSKGTVIEPDYELSVYRHYVTDNTIDDSTIIDDRFYSRKEFENSLRRRKDDRRFTEINKD